MEMDYGGVLGVAAIALAAPLLADRLPRLRIPAVALEILLGMVAGPSVLGWIDIDIPLAVLGTIGLGFLLFLAGLELDLGALSGRFGRLLGAWGLSCVLALGAAYGLHRADMHDSVLLLAIALTSTSLGLVVPILREAGQSRTELGQTILGASSIAEFGSLLLLSVLFSSQGDSPGVQLFLLGVFLVGIGIAAFTIWGVANRTALLSKLDALADTSSQVRVRAVLLVLLVFVALASKLGFEAILGSFAAGVVLRFLDSDRRFDEEKLKHKIEAIGYGFLVPMFFVTSGVKIDLDALLDQPKFLLLVPLLLVAMLVVRAIPAWTYRRILGPPQMVVAGLLQSTNLSIMVIVANLGTATGDLDPQTGAAMVLAGLLSALLLPPVAVARIPGAPALEPDWDERMLD